MITTSAHDIHRLMEDSNLFGPFQRQPATSLSSTYRSSDLLSLPPSQYRTLSSLNSIPPSVPQYKSRAASEILQNHQPRRDKSSVEAEAIDKWFENIQRYEQMLEEVADASLDQGFKDELQQINQWFCCRSDAERTAAYYTVLQNASQIQIRFLIAVLQQLAKREPYPAGQETASEIYQTSTASYQPSLFNAKSSVISAGSEYEAAARRRQQQQQLYPFSSTSSSNRYCTTTRQPRHKLTTTTASAISEPDDIRRRQYLQRDIFTTSRPMGLSNPGPLYEKALAARAQLQAFNSTGSSISGSTGSTTSGSSTTSSSIISSSSLSSSDNNAGNTGGLFSSPPPRLRTSCSTTDISPSAATTNSSGNNNSLFIKSNDWPFPLSSTGTKNSHTLSSSSTTANSRDSSASWAFGSLRASSTSSVTSSSRSSISNKEKKDVLPWSIQEEEPAAASAPLTSRKATGISASLSALEQAQARLRQQEKRMKTASSPPPPPPAPSSSYSSRIQLTHTGQIASTAAAAPTTSTSTTLPSLTEGVVSNATTANVTPVSLYNNLTAAPISTAGPTVKKVTLLTPASTSYIDEAAAAASDDFSDNGLGQDTTAGEKPLTGLARRRKRSSAARALKDKIAAETVDFELMRDVQMWLRTLRLHKYGHAFVGLEWRQVIRMSDQDMIDAGVNTVGARRKLLKVFENVQRHCIEHNIEY